MFPVRCLYRPLGVVLTLSCTLVIGSGCPAPPGVPGPAVEPGRSQSDWLERADHDHCRLNQPTGPHRVRRPPLGGQRRARGGPALGPRRAAVDWPVPAEGRQVQVNAQTSKTLYQGKVTKGFNAGGNYLIFTASFSDDQAAEVSVKDEITVGFKDPGLIPYDKLAKEAKRIPRGKRRYSVSSATLTSVIHKDYKAIKGDAQIAGTAFGANGKVFVSDENFQYEPVISLRLEDRDCSKATGANS